AGIAAEKKIFHYLDNATLGFIKLNATTIYVSLTNQSGDTYTDGGISRAILRSSAGNTIEVDVGTYVETLTIDKNLTLHGANPGLSASDSGSGRGTETIIQAVNTGFGNIVTVNADLTAVTIDGFLFDGLNASSITWNNGIVAGYSAGGTYNLTIQNNIF